MKTRPRVLLDRVAGSLHRRVKHYFVLREARTLSRKNLSSATGGNILVLCYGNIYRSPYVAQRFRNLLGEHKWTIRSAGFYKKTGRPSPESYVSLAGERGINLNEHRSKLVSQSDVDWADLIIIMDRFNWTLLDGFLRDFDHKLIWIGACLDVGRVEIKDPYGMDEEKVRKIINQMDAAVVAMSNKLYRS